MVVSLVYINYGNIANIAMALKQPILAQFSKSKKVTPLIDIWGVDFLANQIDSMHVTSPKGTIFGKHCISDKKQQYVS